MEIRKFIFHRVILFGIKTVDLINQTSISLHFNSITNGMFYDFLSSTVGIPEFRNDLFFSVVLC